MTHSFLAKYKLSHRRIDKAAPPQPEDSTASECSPTIPQRPAAQSLITMEAPTKRCHPSEVLPKLSESMVGQFSELSVTLPIVTTWKQALRAIEEALGDINQEVLVFSKRSKARREIACKIAAGEVQAMLSPSKTSGLLPIRRTDHPCYHRLYYPTRRRCFTGRP